MFWRETGSLLRSLLRTRTIGAASGRGSAAVCIAARQWTATKAGATAAHPTAVAPARTDAASRRLRGISATNVNPAAMKQQSLKAYVAALPLASLRTRSLTHSLAHSLTLTRICIYLMQGVLWEAGRAQGRPCHGAGPRSRSCTHTRTHTRSCNSSDRGGRAVAEAAAYGRRHGCTVRGSHADGCGHAYSDCGDTGNGGERRRRRWNGGHLDGRPTVRVLLQRDEQSLWKGGAAHRPTVPQPPFMLRLPITD